jgi:predicted Fe-Mo cluster-binding NifX family protein
MKNNIAIGVNKANNIWKGHFGISPFFQVYNRDGELIETRVNPHGSGENHKHSHDENQPLLIKEILSDCSTFIGKRMGEGSKLKLAQKLGIETILVETNDTTEALKSLLEK